MMYIPILFAAGWIATAGFLYAQVSNKDVIISELSVEKEKATQALNSESLLVNALTLQLETVRSELREIQVLKEKHAQRSIELEYELTTQDKYLASLQSDSEEYMAAISEIIKINANYKECVKNNITKGTLTQDGSRVYRAGQSKCFSNYRIQIAEVTQNVKVKEGA